MSWLIAWLLLAGPIWAGIGGYVVPRRYRDHNLDSSRGRLVGGLTGASLGPVGLGYLYLRMPDMDRRLLVALPSGVLAFEAIWIFNALWPDNPCVNNPAYVVDQVQSGVVVGLVLATIAVGLTLIYSVQGIVSCAHGQLFMFGGVVAFILLTDYWAVTPILAIPIVGAATFIVGALFDRSMLGPMYTGRIERPAEYAILVTFGFGLFLQFALVGWLGSPSGIKAPRYTDVAGLSFLNARVEIGSVIVRSDFVIAGIIGTALVFGLVLFLNRTWTGMSLRAVSQNREAAGVAGINSRRAFTLSFALGSALAGMAGATLVPVLNFPVPDIAGQAALRSYVIIVLGGLGSVGGAWLGGIFIGVVEALGAGCFPDPNRAAAYQLAFPLIIFALVLLIRPQGFFGRSR